MTSTLARKPDIIIVDDHLIFRRGLKSIITVENIATVIGEASNGTEFIDLLSYLNPDLVLMDIDMPVMNGIDATRQALKLRPELRIIAFTMFGDEAYYNMMIDLGVKGFILKSGGIDELEDAIAEVMKGDNYFSNALLNNINNNILRKNVN